MPNNRSKKHLFLIMGLIESSVTITTRYYQSNQMEIIYLILYFHFILLNFSYTSCIYVETTKPDRLSIQVHSYGTNQIMFYHQSKYLKATQLEEGQALVSWQLHCIYGDGGMEVDAPKLSALDTQTGHFFIYYILICLENTSYSHYLVCQKAKTFYLFHWPLCFLWWVDVIQIIVAYILTLLC